MNQPNTIKIAIIYPVIFGAAVLLASCAATQVALEHHNLETSTRMSNTIFLDPDPTSEKTVYVEMKNTSDLDFEFNSQLASAFESKGYKVTNNPMKAQYLVQANVLKAGKMSIAASETALGGGYGSALAGGVAGAALGSMTNNTKGIVGGGIAGGLIGLAADSLVKDVNYSMITDVQISARVGRGVRMTENFKSSLQNGSATTINQSYSKTGKLQRYSTRIVSTADKVNLKFETAKPALEQGLVKAITGIF